ncbi:C4-dicarboxylate TRAP transporter substrate-binding protein [Amorphus orientalis]|uniref:TRAP-type C4-dicarboxylate transport system substrate-binding protein n=1 Tax=Amorphus orientalis TaxID=649198 RepID=A0AAE4ARX0_9HYPH|nr:C4-dicarboxylate TRAP transporter substrate-binding protein [Amorphus orientalis]MDQ0314325.1 TRAP-type C4-dicarboxylate transport system substrate-binding protein [Amorphus orientalis]
MRTWTKFGIGLGLAAAAAVPASAQETVDLTVVSGFSPTVAAVKMLQESFIPTVNEELAKTGNYEINWQEAFSGTLATPGGELEAVQTGLADVGVIVTAIHSDKIPLYLIGYVTPFTTTDMVLVHNVVDGLVEKYPAFNETWDKFNQVTLSASGIADNYIVCSAKPIESVDDIDGLKIGGIGPNLRWVEPIGGVGVNANLGNFYNMTQTGVTDAILVWGESVVSLKFYEVCPYYFNANLGGANTYAVNVNKQKWETLPEEVQSALETGAKAYSVAIGEFAATLGERAIETFKENGGTVVQIDEQERLEWAATLPNIAQEWADEMEAQGIPGNDILHDYMSAMREADQPIARQWDEN